MKLSFIHSFIHIFCLKFDNVTNSFNFWITLKNKNILEKWWYVTQTLAAVMPKHWDVAKDMHQSALESISWMVLVSSQKNVY